MFYHQTAIMFRKKHSGIDIVVPFRPCSPLRPKHRPRSPLAQTELPRNLSPMKNHNRTPHARTPRPQFLSTTPTKSPRHSENTFDARFESLSSHIHSKPGPSRTFPDPQLGYRTDSTHQGHSFSNLSTVSKENPSDSTLKGSKKLFTKCITEMNSGKHRSDLETSDTGLATPNSKLLSDCKSSSKREPGTVTFFKAIKVQMIESVLPEDKLTPGKRTVEAGLGGYSSNGFDSSQPERRQQAEKIHDFKVFEEEQEAKEQVIELINQSFSNAGTSQLEQKIKLMESVYESEESDYKNFDLLIQNLDFKSVPSKREADEVDVRASGETVRSEFDFDLTQ